MPKTRVALSKQRKRTSRSRCIRNLHSNSHNTTTTHTNTNTVVAYNTNLEETINADNNCDSTFKNLKDDSYSSLEVETVQPPKNLNDILIGRRIVNLGHVLTQYEKILRHPQECTMGKYTFQKEERIGLLTSLYFYCDNCEKTFILTSEPLTKSKDLNKKVVWGCLSIGIGFTQCEELNSVMDIPFMCGKTFAKRTSEVKKVWYDYLQESMKNSGVLERKNAIEKNQFIKIDGKDIPYITVTVDGGWSKRSYGHGYNASSGVAVIIGTFTKRLLYMDVRNKICSMCSYYKRNKKSIKQHECSQNFSGPSTAMEQDIIVKGFQNSIEQHDLVYKYFIGDGDSSVYARIKEKVSYGREVIKIECANHMTRNINEKLHKLGKNINFPLQIRKLLTVPLNGVSRIERIVKGIRTSIKNMSTEKENKVPRLRQAIDNAPYHVFGQHNECSTFCKKNNEENEENLVPQLKMSGFMTEIKKILDPMLQKCDSLAYNETTNEAERFMSLAAKCNGSKRINFTRRDSYTARTYAAALAHTYGPTWHYGPWQRVLTGTHTGNILKKVCEKKKKHLIQFKKRTRTYTKKSSTMASDSEYGPHAAKPDISKTELNQLSLQFLTKLSEQNVEDIEKQTRGQANNKFWCTLRRDRLTASNFGTIFNMRNFTLCGNTVKKLLYGKELSSSATLYGRIHEKDAVEAYKKCHPSANVTECGLFICKQYPFLGASPDRLVDDDGLLEIKCLPFVGQQKFKNVKPKSSCCYEVTSDGIKINRTHKYVLQIQGQLNITGRKYCDLVLYSDNDFYEERIQKDETKWMEMLPKLISFYKDCILPELIDPRVPRSMPIREPEYRTTAHKNQFAVRKKQCPSKRKCVVCFESNKIFAG